MKRTCCFGATDCFWQLGNDHSATSGCCGLARQKMQMLQCNKHRGVWVQVIAHEVGIGQLDIWPKHINSVWITGEESAPLVRYHPRKSRVLQGKRQATNEASWRLARRNAHDLRTVERQLGDHIKARTPGVGRG
jgi:hypothetical protein